MNLHLPGGRVLAAAASLLLLSFALPSAAAQARPGADLCAGMQRVVTKHHVVCTHGPDAAPAGLDVKREIKPLVAAVAAGALPVCEGDGTSGKRVEVLYIHGSTSRYAQYLETFRTLAEGVDNIFNASAAETGGTRHVRYVTENVNGACRAVVRDVQIPDAALNANDWAPLLNAVQAAGYTRTDRKYLQFVDANVYCGIGGFAGDTRKGDSNRSNVGPEYARADNGCWTAGVAAHELGHTLGAVNNNAPNASGAAHCVDEYDVMCYKDSDGVTLVYRCTDRAHDDRLDCNHDDYYHTNPAAGSYLATYYNVADNLFLIKSGTTPPQPTTFKLVNGASGTCLDDPNSSTTNGVQLDLSTCNGSAGQTVTQSGATLQILGKCVDAYGAGTANGTKVILWTCNSGTNQQWTLRSDGSIAGVQSGRCISPVNGGTANGTLLVLADCNGQPYQRWTRS
ncbi:ricin-type beta-trefoil lectin domain protein [Catellatospora sp. KI3]|uniref:ricin-type beta-trefoil lectin domain protein n=1 Tax=Catellatospora sp. KI3 TaxID=3041620 RepID=UPI002482F738|nr:ricin-type beta-trefoil lectin domain protein [Catellatospora sp. KI3]MDI1461573.1 ricin-type beta-trefoil lectin domain protein [Catellatospora sp. KI3]